MVLIIILQTDSRHQIMLETPAGMAIQNFASSRAIHVPRIRYIFNYYLIYNISHIYTILLQI